MTRYSEDLPNPPIPNRTDKRRIADCILTEHHFTHEHEIFPESSRSMGETVTFRRICIHCGAYSIHAVEQGVDGSSIFPTITVPIHRGPDGRMYRYWKIQELNLIVDNHNVKVHEIVREAKEYRIRQANEAAELDRFKRVERIHDRVYPGGVTEKDSG